MTDPNDYDARVKAIRAYNQPILDAFQAWLQESGLAKKTIKSHGDNIELELLPNKWCCRGSLSGPGR